MQIAAEFNLLYNQKQLSAKFMSKQKNFCWQEIRAYMLNISKISRDIIVGIFLLIFCGIILLITLTFEKVPAIVAQGMQPANFPQIIVGAISVLAIIVIFQTKKNNPGQQSIPLMLYLTSGLLIGFVALLTWVGSLAAMFLLCVTLPLLWGERRFFVLSVYSLFFPLSIYFLFFNLLKVRLPSGFFEQLLR